MASVIEEYIICNFLVYYKFLRYCIWKFKVLISYIFQMHLSCTYISFFKTVCEVVWLFNLNLHLAIVIFELVYVCSCFLTWLDSIPSCHLSYSHISHLRFFARSCFLLLSSKDLSLSHSCPLALFSTHVKCYLSLY